MAFFLMARKLSRGVRADKWDLGLMRVCSRCEAVPTRVCSVFTRRLHGRDSNQADARSRRRRQGYPPGDGAFPALVRARSPPVRVRGSLPVTTMSGRLRDCGHRPAWCQRPRDGRAAATKWLGHADRVHYRTRRPGHARDDRDPRCRCSRNRSTSTTCSTPSPR